MYIAKNENKMASFTVVLYVMSQIILIQNYTCILHHTPLEWFGVCSMTGRWRTA